MKLERLISIIYKLLNHDVLSASMLAEEFQVSQRTIYRDIDAICASGFPVVSYQGTNGGYGMMDGYKMDKSLLGSYDVNSLITVLRSLSTVFEDERAQRTIERLQTIEPDHRAASLSVDLETRRAEADALRQLRTAIARRYLVRFDYIDAKNERTSRDMEPLRLHFKYRNWYVYGFCRTRRDYREFRLSRLMNLFVTQETFGPHGEAPEETALANEGWQDRLEDVVIRVGTEALAEAMDQFHQVDKQFHADGSMTMRIPVYRPLEARWLRTILLGFGGGAEVLEPPALRGILKDQLQNALKLYEDV
ncbi:helix-turn-helix transcriptional regulator [Paenibacillaceae bacterium WGS1546]|uniref:helix-turn-helix transcriptional regulator n=1 Tax=Cohnella sp. WGS1546 TaxID=3366810 RepID=UPI00372D1591